MNQNLTQQMAQRVALETAGWTYELLEADLISAFKTPNPKVYLFGFQNGDNPYTHVIMRVDLDTYDMAYEHIVPQEWMQGAEEIPIVPLTDLEV